MKKVHWPPHTIDLEPCHRHVDRKCLMTFPVATLTKLPPAMAPSALRPGGRPEACNFDKMFRIERATPESNLDLNKQASLCPFISANHIVN